MKTKVKEQVPYGQKQVEKRLTDQRLDRHRVEINRLEKEKIGTCSFKSLMEQVHEIQRNQAQLIQTIGSLDLKNSAVRLDDLEENIKQLRRELVEEGINVEYIF